MICVNPLGLIKLLKARKGWIRCLDWLNIVNGIISPNVGVDQTWLD